MKHAGLLILVWALGMTAFADDFKLYYDSNASSATQVEMVDNLKKLTFEKGKMTVVRKDGTNTEVDLTNVKRLFFSTDATAIEEEKKEKTEQKGEVYDLMGRKLNFDLSKGQTLPKGLYIIDGKKVLVK